MTSVPTRQRGVTRVMKTPNREQAQTITINFSIPMVPLCLILLALKIFGVINWSLWWVFSPIWIIPAAIIAIIVGVIGLAIFCLIAAAILDAFSSWRSRRRWAKQVRKSEKLAKQARDPQKFEWRR